jgi:small subunit ribosomal protein S6
MFCLSPAKLISVLNWGLTKLSAFDRVNVPLYQPAWADHFSPQGGPMREYELTVIFPLEEDQYKAGRETVMADLTAQGAEIVKTEETGDRDLAYEIKKRKRARYVLFVIKADPAKITALDRIFKLNPNLLRYLFVKIEE